MRIQRQLNEVHMEIQWHVPIHIFHVFSFMFHSSFIHFSIDFTFAVEHPQNSFFHTIDGINWATLWCSGASQVVRHKPRFGALKLQYDGHIFVFGCVFRKCVLPKGLAEEPPQISLVFIKYNIGAPLISTGFRDASNGPGPETWKQLTNNKKHRFGQSYCFSQVVA